MVKINLDDFLFNAIFKKCECSESTLDGCNKTSTISSATICEVFLGKVEVEAEKANPAVLFLILDSAFCKVAPDFESVDLFVVVYM